MNRCIRGPYVQWCERRTSSLTSGEAAYSITCSLLLFCSIVGTTGFNGIVSSKQPLRWRLDAQQTDVNRCLSSVMGLMLEGFQQPRKPCFFKISVFHFLFKL